MVENLSKSCQIRHNQPLMLIPPQFPPIIISEEKGYKMHNAPAGLTSSVTADGKKYILQTEFLATPEPHVVTTVVYKGQVVHKVEKIYSQNWDTPDGFSDAEKLIKTTHISVAEPSLPALAISALDHGNPGIRRRPTAVNQRIAEVTEVCNEMLANRAKAAQKNDPIMKNICLIKDVVVAITQNSRLGKLKRAVGSTSNQKFILTGFGGKTFMLGLKRMSTFRAFLTN